MTAALSGIAGSKGYCNTLVQNLVRSSLPMPGRDADFRAETGKSPMRAIGIIRGYSLPASEGGIVRGIGLFGIACFIGLFGFISSAARADTPPNIVYVLTDDLGFGDVSCFNGGSKIQTTR